MIDQQKAQSLSNLPLRAPAESYQQLLKKIFNKILEAINIIEKPFFIRKHELQFGKNKDCEKLHGELLSLLCFKDKLAEINDLKNIVGLEEFILLSEENWLLKFFNETLTINNYWIQKFSSLENELEPNLVKTVAQSILAVNSTITLFQKAERIYT